MLQVQWYHNTLRTWLMAAAIALVVFIGLSLVRRLARSHLTRLTRRTTNHVDDMLLTMVRETRTWVLVVLAIYSGAQELTLPRVSPLLHPAAMLVLLWQAGLWGVSAVAFWVKQYLERSTSSNDRASVAMITALGVGAKVLLWVLLLITALKSVFSIEITPLITGLGVGGIAVALAVQNILGDLLAALAIVFDRPFDVGDFISVDDVSGTVEQIGLKTTRLRALSGEQIVLGNGDLLKSRLHNYRRMYQRRVVFQLDVAQDTPPEVLARLPGIVQGVITAQSPVKFDRAHVKSPADSAIQIEAVYNVLDSDYTLYMNIQQAVALGVLRSFASENVRLALPSRALYQMHPQGAAPALVTGPAPVQPGAGGGA